MSSGSDRFEIKNQQIGSLASSLEHKFSKPVVNQTGLKGNYDIQLKWTENNIESLKQALAEQLGLELIPSREQIEMLIIEPAQN